MANTMKKPLKFGVFLTLAACLALPAMAAGPAEGGLADLEIGGTTLTVNAVASGRYSFRVTGPEGFTYEAEIRGGESLSFEIFDAAGNLLPDGTYSYELTAWAGKPKAAERENLRGLAKRRAGAQQSGVFTILNGSLVDPSVEETIERPTQPTQKAHRQGVPTKDQVILDDLIVDGSACIGFDCVNGESFGFDTIRIKENNLRIKAQDTSSTASFPSRDWQITFNDSANGGANKFSIDDIDGGRTPFTIEAGAPSHSLYVDDGGRLGLGTSTPVVDLHVKSGNTPTLRLEQDGTSGFTPQTWDVAGNEANFFIRDATNGSTLPFRIIPGAPSNAIYVASDGDVGMGTTSPGAQIHVSDTASVNLRLEGDSAGFQLIDVNGPTNEGVAQQFVNAGEWRLRGVDDALALETVPGIVVDLGNGNVGLNCTSAPAADLVVGDASGACTGGTRSQMNAGDAQFTVPSSRTYKENLVAVETGDILEKITGIDVYSYDYINGPKERLGLMAEDFHQIFGRGSDKLLNGQEVQMALWLAIQELTAKVSELEAALALEAAAATP